MTPSLDSIISRLHVKQLRLLIALGEHGSLLGAAKQLALTQPGASKALHEIETTFGARLFVRTNRGLEPNAVGHCVIRYARLIQTDLVHLREEIVGIMRGYGGRVSVGVIMGAVPLLTDALSSVSAEQPEMSVEIIEDTSATLLSLIDAGRLDLAICRTSVSQRRTSMTVCSYVKKRLRSLPTRRIRSRANAALHSKISRITGGSSIGRTCRCGCCSNGNSTTLDFDSPLICWKRHRRSQLSRCCREMSLSSRWYRRTSRTFVSGTVLPAPCRCSCRHIANPMNW